MKKALTMAELLVTMTIIGAIAVLVLPGFLKDYHNQLYVTKLKKVYEMFDNAVNQACLDHNVSKFKYTPYRYQGTNSETEKSYYQEFLEKYFKTSNNGDENPFAAIRYKKIGVTSSTGSLLSLGSYAKVRLADGAIVAFMCSATTLSYCRLIVDVNGADGPNIGGRDLFSMYVNVETNEIYDHQAANNYCGNGSGTPKFALQGNGCFGRILKDNWKMNY
ncbi:MAG: type II secretion system protein [Cyanobacteria bacterium SIG26]|nr:type II secretion system protein [Cyanobacteria bacterium SIG26]